MKEQQKLSSRSHSKKTFYTWSILFTLVFSLILTFPNVSAFSWDDTQITSYYAKDATSGNVIDVKGLNDGTNFGATRGVAGKLNASFDYEIENGDYVNLSGNPLFGIGSGDFTVNTWFNPSHLNTTHYIVSIGKDIVGVTDASLNIFISGATNQTQVSAYQNGAFSINQPLGFANESNWYMVTIVRDSTTLRTYYNGVSVSNNSMVGSYNSLFEDFGKLGDTVHPSNRNPFNGIIDDTFFMNASINVSEVQSLYNSGLGLFKDEQAGAPKGTLTSPANNTNILIGANQDFDVSTQGFELANVSAYVDGVLNETINISGNTNTSTFSLSFTTGTEKKINFVTCTNWNCEVGSNFTFSLTNYTANSYSFNATSYETQTETYVLNITTNGNAPTNAKLSYGGTNYTATVALETGNTYTITRSITHPTTGVGNNSFSFWFDLEGNTINSDLKYQDVQTINFAQCSAAPVYLNVTFKDEEANTFMNASIPTATFEYYLGDGTQTKTLTYTNSTENPDYGFCLNVTNEAVTVDMRIQYEADGYPQRVYDPEAVTLTNVTTNTTLYLLATSGNQYVTTQFINTAEQTLIGVDVTVTRSIGGEDVIVSQGTSDSSGSVTFFLDPDFVHTFTYELSGYTTLTQSYAPTQTEYTVTLESTSASSSNDYSQGMSFSLTPANITLVNNTNYTFGLTLNSDLWQLDSFGFVLRDENGTIVATQTSTSTSGGTVTVSYNTGTNSDMKLDYFWEVNDTYVNGTRIWYVVSSDGTDWSLLVALNNTRNTLNSGIFGATPFTVAILTFLFIFIFVGIISWKFGLTNPAAVSAMTFVLVAICDVGFGLFGDFKLAGAIPNLPTIFIGGITIALFLREASR